MRKKMVNTFQNTKWKKEYVIEINNKFEILENFKAIIKETKQQLTEKDEGTETFKNKWYDEEYKFEIEEMKKAREKWLIKGRREDRSITIKEKKLTK
jgi:hypothetical protein